MPALSPLYRLLRLMTVLVSAGAAAADDRPNILIIMADDLGYADVGFTGSEEIQTPRLDALAAGGVVFENGYVTHPYCGPSRAGFVTGRYQARFGVEVNFTYSPYDAHSGLPVDQPTFGERLKPAGYRTGIIGKWHLGAAPPPFHPNRRGFDHFYGFLSGGHDYFPDRVNFAHDLLTDKGTNHYSANEGAFLPLNRNLGAGEFTEYLTTALSRDAAAFVAEGDAPFCLFLAYNAPHGPLQAPADLIEKYRDVEPRTRRVYAAMIDSMDQGIGRVVDALKASGKYENTLIFFLSDNGGVAPKSGHENENWANNAPFKKGKGSMMEGGTHVPFIAHWPAKIPAGTRFADPVSALDITATAVALGGGDTSGPDLEGVNLIPHVRGEVAGPPHAAIFWRLRDGVGWAVRTPGSKLLLEGRKEYGEGVQLYDMAADPYESENLASTDVETRKELAGLWNTWNAGNRANRYYQAGEYQTKRRAFYDQMREALDLKASKAEPRVVE